MADLRTIAALFVRRDSGYKGMPGVDCYDIERDARTWPGGCPVVAHPPCRAWGQLKHMATKVRPDEKALALWAVEQVRTWGGVLEHPVQSSLWPAAGLPQPGAGVDAWGGWSIVVDQSWWAHRAAKRTKFYVVGCRPGDAPDMPISLDRPTHVIGSTLHKGEPGWRPRVTDAEREHTPPTLAVWLVELARRCHVQPMRAAA